MPRIDLLADGTFHKVLTEEEKLIFELIEKEIKDREGSYSDLLDRLQQEEAERIAQDTQIRDTISNLADATSAADQQLEEALSTERQERISADDDLWIALQAEEAARISADNELTDKLNDEATIRYTNDNLITHELNVEKQTRASADSNLQQQIDALSSSSSDTFTSILNKEFFTLAEEQSASKITSNQYTLSTALDVVSDPAYVVITNTDGTDVIGASGNHVVATKMVGKTITFSEAPNAICKIKFAHRKTFATLPADALIVADVVDSRKDADISEIIGHKYFDSTKSVATHGSLDERIDQEVSARQAADNNLDTQLRQLIQAETSARSSAINNLQSQLSTLTTNFNNHNHDSHYDARYDARYVKKSGDTISGNFTIGKGALLRKTTASGSTVTIIDDQGRVWNAVYNDLAEMFPCKGEMRPGDVLVWDGEHAVRSTKSNQKNVIGVYSDTYGHCLGGWPDREGYVPIGIAGKVKVWTKGRCEIGDLLVSSSEPGVAEKAVTYVPGSVFAKALENKTSEEPERIWALIVCM